MGVSAVTAVVGAAQAGASDMAAATALGGYEAFILLVGIIGVACLSNFAAFRLKRKRQ